jgi:microcompartment protein CcmL/EutN
LVEIGGYSPSLVAVDAMEKAADIQIIQAELNDMLGVIVKFTGSVADVKYAVAAAEEICSTMQVKCQTSVIPRPAESARAAAIAPPERSPLIEQEVVHTPTPRLPTAKLPKEESKENTVSQSVPQAIGFIETQGFTAVIEAIDTACKAANVEVIGREKLGGGYITVMLQGDVAAVKAAVEAGSAKVNGLGKLIASHVIARPSASILALLPK